jgi:tRNA A-37 threonylcarbamoyl transferase component Bud32
VAVLGIINMQSAEPPPSDATATLPPRQSANLATLAAAEATTTATPTTVGDYEILGEIARGGMGVVFRARQRSANRIVALKMILSGGLAGSAEVRRFHAEAEAAAGLDHPNVLPVYEVGEHEGRPFFSMKFAPGGTLADRVADLVADPARSVALVAKLALAVHFAHQRGILHRDLKPANVLLDADGTPLITDFGLAKRTGADAGMTQSGAIVGTPSYMAPEQARSGKAVTTASDVYALGAILYELLAGKPPFRGETVIDTLILVMEQAPEDPRRANPQADRDLCAVALKCLEKNPADRYESAAALADDLDRWTAGEPTRARPLSPPAQIWRWVKRHTTATFAFPVFAFVLGIWPAFVVEVQVAPELLPRSLDTPLGWYRILKTVPGMYVVAVVMTLALFVGFGWLVVRVARPKTVASTIGFAAGVAVAASILSAMFTAPVVIEMSRIEAGSGDNRIHPIGDGVADDRWLSEAVIPGTEAHAEAEYLKEFLEPEKRSLDHVGWQDDIRQLRQNAAQVNRLRAGYLALAEELLYGTIGTILWAMFSTWVVIFLDRSHGRRWSNLVRYLELTVPTLFGVGAAMVVIVIGPPGEDRAVIIVIASYFAVVAVVAWIGVVRRWRWWVRWGLYMAITVALLGVAVAVALADAVNADSLSVG